MARRLLNLLTALSLLLFVAVWVLWVRSYLGIDRFVDGGLPDEGERSWQAVSFRGRISVGCMDGVWQETNRASPNWERNWLIFATGGPASPTQPVEGIFVRDSWFVVP